jgi:hypothetical protein
MTPVTSDSSCVQPARTFAPTLPEHDIDVVDGVTQLNLKRNTAASISTTAMAHRRFFSPLSLAPPPSPPRCIDASNDNPRPLSSPILQVELTRSDMVRENSIDESNGKESGFDSLEEGERGSVALGEWLKKLEGKTGAESASEDKIFAESADGVDVEWQGVAAAEVYSAARNGTAAWDAVVARLLRQLEEKVWQSHRRTTKHVSSVAAAVSAAVTEARRWWQQ